MTSGQLQDLFYTFLRIFFLKASGSSAIFLPPFPIEGQKISKWVECALKKMLSQETKAYPHKTFPSHCCMSLRYFRRLWLGFRDIAIFFDLQSLRKVLKKKILRTIGNRISRLLWQGQVSTSENLHSLRHRKGFISGKGLNYGVGEKQLFLGSKGMACGI